MTTKSEVLRRKKWLMSSFGLWSVLLSILALVLFLPSAGMKAKADYSDKRVLFISSYSYGWPTVEKQISGIREALGDDVTIDFEFMSTRQVYDGKSVELFYNNLKYHLENGKPYDVILLGNDAALTFGMEYQDELFDGIPMIFLGVGSEELARQAGENPMITGLVEKVYPEENIAFGLRMNPNAKRVYAILDDSPTGEAFRERYYDCTGRFPKLEFLEINASEYTDTGLKIALRSVESDSIVLYFSVTGDSKGNKYSADRIMQLIREAGTVPVLTMVDIGIGDGFVGGYVSPVEDAGKKAGEMALNLIRGGDIEDMGVVTETSSRFIADELVMKQYNISSNVLPRRATVINHTLSYFERNKEILIPVALLVIVLLLIILFFCVENMKHKKLLQELEDARAILESASQHDFLTGLPNRSKFMEDIEKVIAEEHPCTVMMIDIDDFKSINDNYGHTAGDQALQVLASRLMELQSQILTAYRFAGDEFILILRSSQWKIVEKTAYACRQMFSREFTLCDRQMKIYGSIGIASYPKDAEDAEQLVICADNAMYQVKKNGKNDFAFYHKEDGAE